MKTIFYKEVQNNEKADYWFGETPFKEWFSLDNTLYEPNGNVKKNTIIKENNKKIIHSVSIHQTQDTFSDDGIIRRIAVYISD